MIQSKGYLLVISILMTIIVVLPGTDSSLKFAKSAQKSISEVSNILDIASNALKPADETKAPVLSTLSKATSKLSGLFGIFGALFSIILAFIPKGDSAEIKYMRTEFAKLTEKIDTVARSLDETKALIKYEAQKSVYLSHEHNIHYGYSQLESCLEKLQHVTCSNPKDCRYKKLNEAEGYIKSLNVGQSLDAVVRGMTSNITFGDSLFELLKRESKCNVPKINRLANKAAALIMKGITVLLFHDLLTKTNYKVSEGVVLGDKMLRDIENKRQELQDDCFKNVADWMTYDVRNSNDIFSSDLKSTNRNVLIFLKKKYPWIFWMVFTGTEKPSSGPSWAPIQGMHSSSKTHGTHCIAIPGMVGHVINERDKIDQWKKLVKKSIKGRLFYAPNEDYKNDIETGLKQDTTFKNQIQSFAVLGDKKGIYGDYDDKVVQTKVLSKVTKPFFAMTIRISHHSVSELQMIVLFKIANYPTTCSKQCNGKGKCFIFPYSTQLGCRCNTGHSGENCESAGLSLKLKSVIQTLVQNTMKLPTFLSIQKSIR